MGWIDQLIADAAKAALDKLVLTNAPVAEAAERSLDEVAARHNRTLSGRDRAQLLELVVMRMEDSLGAKRSFNAVTNRQTD